MHLIFWYFAYFISFEFELRYLKGQRHMKLEIQEPALRTASLEGWYISNTFLGLTVTWTTFGLGCGCLRS